MTRRLPDIRELAHHDAPRDRSSAGWLLLAASTSLVAIALLTWSGRIAWSVLRAAELHRGASAIGLAAWYLALATIVAVALRRHGRGLIPYLAVILPLVTWLVVIMLMIVVAGLTDAPLGPPPAA